MNWWGIWLTCAWSHAQCTPVGPLRKGRIEWKTRWRYGNRNCWRSTCWSSYRVVTSFWGNHSYRTNWSCWCGALGTQIHGYRWLSVPLDISFFLVLCFLRQFCYLRLWCLIMFITRWLCRNLSGVSLLKNQCQLGFFGWRIRIWLWSYQGITRWNCRRWGLRQFWYNSLLDWLTTGWCCRTFRSTFVLFWPLRWRISHSFLFRPYNRCLFFFSSLLDAFQVSLSRWLCGQYWCITLICLRSFPFHLCWTHTTTASLHRLLINRWRHQRTSSFCSLCSVLCLTFHTLRF